MNTIKIILISILAYILATAVIMSSLHVKDIVSNSSTLTSSDATRSVRAHMDDVSAKAIGELHNHVDKTVLKSLVKSMTDQATISRSRQQVEDPAEIDRSFSVILMEMLLMFRLTYATALIR